MKAFGLLSVVLGLGVMAAACGFNDPTTRPLGNGSASNLAFGGEAIHAEHPPALLSGGTLTASRVRPYVAYAANPDAGTVEIVDWDRGVVLWRAELGEKSEPGRIVEDAKGLVYVALRRAGQIAILTRDIARKEVCPAPRGLALDGDSPLLRARAGIWSPCRSRAASPRSRV